MSSKVTVCLTSCNRFDLLKTTVDSFLSLNSYPIERFIITEDSGNIDMLNNIKNYFKDKVEVVFNPINLGAYKSIDNMYNMVNTEYIFHSEDDWHYSSNKNFIQESLNILDERKDLHQIWLRSINEFPSWIDPVTYKTSFGTSYKIVKYPHCGNWCGFSLNPGLRRLDDYKKMFPNGYAEFIAKGKFSGESELNCNNHAAKQGYRAAILVNHTCKHLGYGRTVL